MRAAGEHAGTVAATTAGASGVTRYADGDVGVESGEREGRAMGATAPATSTATAPTATVHPPRLSEERGN